MEVYRKKPIFDMARAGYERLFLLNHDDGIYVQNRLADMRNKTEISDNENGMEVQEKGIILGVHVRHGDRHPFEFQYQDSYIPLDRYTDKAREILQTTFAFSSLKGGEDLMAEMNSLVAVASDDPNVYASEEFSHAWRAQDLIRLASQKTASSPKKPVAAIRKFIDETVGWEGGFFAGMFWSLGKPSSTPATAVEAPVTSLPPTTETLRLRELVGRAYLMDLAVLGRSDAVVCTVSSTGCRLLAVMMGWDAAVVKGRWFNIDGDFSWNGIAW